MTLKLNRLATAVTFVFATACAAQTPPQAQPTMTTESTTTETQPTTTTQSTTTQDQPTASQPATTTQTTTEETQPTASQPATTTQTTTTQATTTEATLVPAKAADIKAGATVYDKTGALVGKVDSVKADNAIVNTGKARAEIPLSSFGKNDKGLVVSVTKADLDAQAKEETTKPKS